MTGLIITLTLLTLFFGIVGVTLIYISGNDDDLSLLPVGIIVLIMYTTTVVSLNIVSTEDKYKQGQIDALNGVVKYELVEQLDGSTEWENKEETK